MVLEAAKTHTVRCIAVIQAWIASFRTVQVAVEGGYFNADFWHQITGQVRGEGWRIVRTWMWEEVGVELVCYWRLAAHCGCSACVGDSEVLIVLRKEL